MPTKILKDFLDQNNIKYITIKHSLAYTAQEVAASSHIKGNEMAKTVLVKINGKMVMAVLPASHKIDFEKLKEVVGAPNVRLANEIEFKDKFPDCEVGAMPPFGNLYGMDVYFESALAQFEEVAFNACSHTELYQLKYKDYENLVKPKIANFSFLSKL